MEVVIKKLANSVILWFSPITSVKFDPIEILSLLFYCSLNSKENESKICTNNYWVQLLITWIVNSVKLMKNFLIWLRVRTRNCWFELENIDLLRTTIGYLTCRGLHSEKCWKTRCIYYFCELALCVLYKLLKLHSSLKRCFFKTYLDNMIKIMKSNTVTLLI